MQHTVGQSLRDARERKGLTLSEAAAQTKIKLSQLEAMERDDFSSMAAPLYVKGFVRLYAKVLGLDPAPLIDSMFATPAEPVAPAVPALAPENTSRMLRKKSQPSPEYAPTVSAFDPDAPFAPPAAMGPVKAAPSPPPRAEPAAPTSDAPGGSAIARRLASAQAALNSALESVKRPARSHAAETAPSAPAPSAEPSSAFDFPRPSARAPKAPAPKPSAPDLFAFAEQARAVPPPETPANQPAPVAATPPPPSSVLSVSSVPPAPVPPAVTPAPPAAAAKAGRIRHTASIFPRPAARTADARATTPRAARKNMVPTAAWKDIADPALAFLKQYGARIVLVAGAVALVWVLILSLRGCDSAPRPLPADAPSGYAELPFDPYLPPADTPAPPAARP
jgi:cytoskeleton protein RodZ